MFGVIKSSNHGFNGMSQTKNVMMFACFFCKFVKTPPNKVCEWLEDPGLPDFVAMAKKLTGFGRTNQKIEKHKKRTLIKRL